MKREETEVLITYRLEQAQTDLDYAKYLLDGRRSPQSIINRSYLILCYVLCCHSPPLKNWENTIKTCRCYQPF